MEVLFGSRARIQRATIVLAETPLHPWLNPPGSRIASRPTTTTRRCFTFTPRTWQGAKDWWRRHEASSGWWRGGQL